MNPGHFFAELKRRNVYKVAVAYAVVGWLLIQIATQVFPFFEIPNWGVRFVVLLIMAGLPIALIIAWAFELTPEGLKRTEASESAQPPPSARRAWIFVVLIAGLMSLGLFFLGRYTAPNENKMPALPSKSIAVLPFANLSRDPDNAYFAYGIQDEIITRLSKIAELKVISCTSTQRFKSSPEDLPSIARELGVANILEGSVQRAGGQVRVNVQLVKAAGDEHLWAETFDRQLHDIFQIESEIATAIAATLQAKLTGSETRAIAARPTGSTEAHQLYLLGRFFWNKRTGPDLQKAIGYFNQAVEKDPGYALAYAGLADASVLLSGFGAAAPQASFPSAERAARKALELDDTLAEAHTSLGFILAIYDLDFPASMREFERALALNPNYATAHHWFGNSTLLLLGQFDRAISEGRRAVDLDPLSLIINADLGADYLEARRYDEAIVQLRKTLEMDPGFYYARWNLAQALELKGDFKSALAEYKKTAELTNDPSVLGLLGQAYAKEGQREKAQQILSQLEQIAREHYVWSYSFAVIYLALGEKDKAIDWLEHGFREGAGLDLVYIKVDPMLDPLQGEPRFKTLVQKVFASEKGTTGTSKPSP
jgi:TolB-like protein/tetratricopeptide (TPR) repeat protein